MTDAASEPPDENGAVRFEETLGMRDGEGAGRIVGWIGVAVAFLVLTSLASFVLVAVVAVQGVATTVGGMGVLREFAGQLLADRPVAVAAVAVAALLFVLVGVAFVWLTVRSVSWTLDREVHVQVSDDGVSVRRSGSRFWQSSGVDVPFDDVTTVEYVDPEASSLRVELGDVRAPKFFAGRSQNWVRLERAAGPAVYVGSDRPGELAEAIARRVPGDVTARPY